jgi:hypothetical protein
MTKAFLSTSRRLQNAKNSLLKMVNRILDRLTAKLKRFFEDIIADSQIPTSEPAYKLPKLAGPVHNLGGGGPDVDDAIQWMINQVRGGSNSNTKVNVLVISSG